LGEAHLNKEKNRKILGLTLVNQFISIESSNGIESLAHGLPATVQAARICTGVKHRLGNIG
jgi:hypothetical protein